MTLWTWHECHLTQKRRLYYTRAHQNSQIRATLAAFISITSNVIHLGDFVLCTLIMTLGTWQGHCPTQKHRLYYTRAHQNSQKGAALAAFSSITSNVVLLSLRLSQQLVCSISRPPAVQIASNLEGTFSCIVCTPLFFLVAIRGLGAWEYPGEAQKMLFPAFLVIVTRCGHLFPRLSRGGGGGDVPHPFPTLMEVVAQVTVPKGRRNNTTIKYWATGVLLLALGRYLSGSGVYNNELKYRKPCCR